MEQSIWKNSIDLPQFSQLKKTIETEILIIGGGIAGILCAHKLQNEGHDVILIESDTIGCGATANTTAKITSQHGLIYQDLIKKFGAENAAKYLAANEMAINEFRSVAQKYPCDFEEISAYLYTIDRPHKLEQELSALKKIGHPASYINSMPLPFSTAGAVRFKNQAQFHPLKLVAQLSKELRCYEHTPALKIEADTVITPAGRIKAKKTIVTTHFPIFNKVGLYPLKMYQERSYIIALKNAPNVRGIYLCEQQGGLSIRNYKDYLLLGGGNHRTGKQGQGWKTLAAAAKRLFPDATLCAQWANQDCITLDKMPYIGQYSPHTPNLFVATGFNKWGMSLSMVASSIICNLIGGKENSFTDLFSPARSILSPKLLINAGESAINLINPKKPRCSHLGCALKWNPYEHSWDCPCHGSRFDKNGNVLNSPAIKTLDTKSRLQNAQVQ